MNDVIKEIVGATITDARVRGNGAASAHVLLVLTMPDGSEAFVTVFALDDTDTYANQSYTNDGTMRVYDVMLGAKSGDKQ